MKVPFSRKTQVAIALIATADLLACRRTTGVGVADTPPTPADVATSGDSSPVDTLLTACLGPGSRIERRAGPFDTNIHQANLPGGPVGQDRKTCVVSEGRAFGTCCTNEIAVLAARFGCDHPDSLDDTRVADLIRLVDAGAFDGLLGRVPGTTASATCVNGALTLELTRRTYPSHSDEQVRIDLPPTGPMRITRIPPPQPAVALSPREALEAALDADDGAAVTAAIRTLAKNVDLANDAPALALLARVAALSHEPLALVALEVIPTSEVAAEALGKAFRALEPAAAASRIAFIAELHDPRFAASVKRAMTP